MQNQHAKAGIFQRISAGFHFLFAFITSSSTFFIAYLTIINTATNINIAKQQQEILNGDISITGVFQAVSRSGIQTQGNRINTKQTSPTKIELDGSTKESHIFLEINSTGIYSKTATIVVTFDNNDHQEKYSITTASSKSYHSINVFKNIPNRTRLNSTATIILYEENHRREDDENDFHNHLFDFILNKIQ